MVIFLGTIASGKAEVCKPLFSSSNLMVPPTKYRVVDTAARYFLLKRNNMDNSIAPSRHIYFEAIRTFCYWIVCDIKTYSDSYVRLAVIVAVGGGSSYE